MSERLADSTQAVTQTVALRLQALRETGSQLPVSQLLFYRS